MGTKQGDTALEFFFAALGAVAPAVIHGVLNYGQMDTLSYVGNFIMAGTFGALIGAIVGFFIGWLVQKGVDGLSNSLGCTTCH